MTGINDTIINHHDDGDDEALGADHNTILDWPQNSSRHGIRMDRFSVASRAYCDQYDHYGPITQASTANHLVDRAEVDLYEMFSV